MSVGGRMIKALVEVGQIIVVVAVIGTLVVAISGAMVFYFVHTIRTMMQFLGVL